jgi:hypothetical protein
MTRIDFAIRTILTAAIGAAVACVPPVSLTPMSCQYGAWSSLRRAVPEPKPSAPVASWPSVASAGGKTYVAGTDVKSYGPNRMSDRALTVSTLDGRSLGRPAGPFWFERPILLADARGRLHLLWGEFLPDSLPKSDNERLTFPKIATVWTSMYDPSSPTPRWSSARRLLEGPRLQWDLAESSDGDNVAGHGSVAVPLRTPVGGTDGSVAVLRFAGDSLVASKVALPSETMYGMLGSAGDTLYLAVIADMSPPHEPSMTPQEAETNGVWLKRSLDGGRTWEQESPVSVPGDPPAHQVKVHVSPDGHVHLLWQRRETATSWRIRHVESADAGRTWSAPEDLQVSPVVFANLRSVMDACGALHVLHEYLGPPIPHMRLEYATWRNGWSAAEPLFPDVAVIRTTIARAPDGRLMLVTQSEAAEAPVHVPSALWVADKRPANR